jgi:hypothetical protein
MSEELKLKLVFDTKDAARAADALPDAMERSGRKRKRFWESESGDSTFAAAYPKLAGAQKEIEKALKKEAAEKQKAAEAAARAAQKQAESDQKANNDKYERDLKFNSKIVEEQDKKAISEYESQLRWNSKLQEDKDKAAAAEEQSKLDEYRKKLQWNSRGLEQEDKKKLDEYKKQLRWNSKLQEDRDKALASADDWEKSFTKKILGGLTATDSAAGVFMTLLKGGYSSFSQAFNRGSSYSTSTAAYSTEAQDAFEAYIVMKNLSDLKEEEVKSKADRAASMAQDIATGVTGTGAQAFQYFGMDRAALQKANSEGFKFTELLANMSDRYKTSGETPQFQQFARELLGDDWKKYRTALAAGRAVVTSGVPVTLESTPVRGPLAPGLVNVNVQRLLQGEAPLSDLRGGGGGGMGQPSMPFATSLQAMGGGDILSAVNRGPMDNLVSAAEETAQNTRVLNDTFSRRIDLNNRTSVVKE